MFMIIKNLVMINIIIASDMGIGIVFDSYQYTHDNYSHNHDHHYQRAYIIVADSAEGFMLDGC